MRWQDNTAYVRLAHDGERMTTGQMAAYAYGQIDQTRVAPDTHSR